MIYISILVSLYFIYRSSSLFKLLWLSGFSILIVFALNKETNDFISVFSLYVFAFTLCTALASHILDNNSVCYTSELILSNKVAYCAFFLSVFFFVVGIGGVSNLKHTWIEMAISRSALQQVLSNFSPFFYLLSIAIFLNQYLVNRGSVSPLVHIIFLAILYLIISRVKAFMLPAIISILAVYIEINKQKLGKLLINSAFLGMSAISLYLFTTVVRWYGNLDEFSFEHLLTVVHSVLDAGVERNLIFQSTQIYNYFSQNDILYGQTYLSFLSPLFKVIGVHIQNPMHLYSELLYGKSYVMRGSVHPTLYVDSFANFGPFGVLVPIFWVGLTKLVKTFRVYQNSLGFSFLVVILSYSIPLIYRGSVYYGFLYIIIYSVLFVSLFLILESLHVKK